MRTLVVDGLRLAGARTAVGRHIEYLAGWWSTNEIPFDRVLIVVREPCQLAGLGPITPVEVRVTGRRLPNLLWEQGALPVAARGASVLFCEYTCPVVAPVPPVVVANHGIYEALPQTFTRLQRLRATAVNRSSARRATRVVANSTNTRDDLVRFFDLAADRIDVVFPAPAAVFRERHDAATIEAERHDTLGGDEPYVMFVGKFSRRRHVPRLVEAFAAARERLGSSHRLLLVGPDVTGVDPIAMARGLGIAGSVTHVPHLEQDRLARLYAGAELFVLPSEYEGLSWTMLEAMASGTAVLTVAHPTVEEAAGDSVATIPEPTTELIRDAMVRLLSDPPERRRLAAAGSDRVQRFTPDAVARETTRILDEAARPRDRR